MKKLGWYEDICLINWLIVFDRNGNIIFLEEIYLFKIMKKVFFKLYIWLLNKMCLFLLRNFVFYLYGFLGSFVFLNIDKFVK